MLALLGFLGLAMSSFVMIGDEETADAPTDAADDPANGNTGGDLLDFDNLQSDADRTASGLSDGFGDAGAGAVLDDEIAGTAGGTLSDAGASGTDILTDDTTAYGDDLLPDPPVSDDSAAGPITLLTGTDGADTIMGDSTADEIQAQDGGDRPPLTRRCGLDIAAELIRQCADLALAEVSLAGHGDLSTAEVRSQDPHVPGVDVRQQIAQQHGQCVRLLSG